MHIAECYAHLPKTKNGEKRDVPLSPAAIGILEPLRPLAEQIDGRVFGVEEGGHDALFRKACKRAMIEDLRGRGAAVAAAPRSSERRQRVALGIFCAASAPTFFPMAVPTSVE